MPLKTSLSNIGFLLLGVFTLLSYFKNGLNLSFLKRKSLYFLSPLVFFIPLVIGFFYSPLKMEALEELEKLFLLALTPLFLGLRNKFCLKKELKWAKYGLIFGSLLSALIVLTVVLYKISSGPFTAFFVFSPFHTNMGFTQPLGIHPIYLGSYYVMGLVFLLNKNTPIKKWLRILGTAILFIAIIFLNSRIIYFSTFLVTFIYLMDYLPWQKFAILVTVLIIAFAMIFPYLKTSYVYEKAVSGTEWDLTQNVGTYNTDKEFKSDSRMSRWIVSWELIKKRPFFGSGTGTENEQLNKKYDQYHMETSIKQSFNAHNQFLGFMIRFGVWSAVLIMVFFVGNFYSAFRYKDLAFLGFLLIVGCIFLIENYIDRNMGINFLALFGTLFFLNTYQNQRETKKTI